MNRRTGPVVAGVLLAVVVAVVVVLRPWSSDDNDNENDRPVVAAAAIGDCVVSPDGLSEARTGQISGSPAGELVLGPCSGTVFAEVVSVNPRAESSTPTATADECRRRALEFVGQDVVDPDAAPGDPAWELPVRPAVLLAASTTDGAGGRGSEPVCAVGLPVRSALPTEPTERGWTGSLRSAVQTGVEADRLGFCTDSSSATGTVVDCAAPHRGEMFGNTTLEETATRDDLRRSCTQWISLLTGLADPTLDGALTVELVARDPIGAEITVEWIAFGALLRCGLQVNGDRLLDGSLRAVADGPVPWVS